MTTIPILHVNTVISYHYSHVISPLHSTSQYRTIPTIRPTGILTLPVHHHPMTLPPQARASLRDVPDGLNVPQSLKKRSERISKVDLRSVRRPRKRLPSYVLSRLRRTSRRVN